MSVDILTNEKFDEKIDELITEIKKGIGNSDLFQKVGDEQINVGDGTVSNAINVLADKPIIREHVKIYEGLTVNSQDISPWLSYNFAKEGYTAIGIIGHRFDNGTYPHGLNFVANSIFDNTMYYQISNIGDYAATNCNVEVDVLYVKNEIAI